MHFLIILFSVGSTFIISGLSFLLLRLYLDYRHRGLALVSLGFALFTFMPLSYLLFVSDISNPEIISLIFTPLLVIGMSFGVIIILVGFRILMEMEILYRHYFEIVLGLFMFPYVMYHFMNFGIGDDGEWVITYDPFWTKYVIAFYVFIISLELALSVYYLIRDSPSNELKMYYYINLPTLFLALGLFVVRGLIINIINIHVVGISLYFLSLGYMIYSKPDVFLTTTVNPQFILVLNRRTGLPVKIYHFIESDMMEVNDVLFAGALTAIQAVMKESSSSSSSLQHMKMGESTLLFENNDDLEFVLAAETHSNSLKTMLIRISENYNPEKVDLNELDDLEALISTTFYHQLNRLDLFLKEVSLDRIK